jgi:predicted ester cyclase
VALNRDGAVRVTKETDAMSMQGTAEGNKAADACWVVEDMVAEGDEVVTRWPGHGLHDGDLPGLPATGKRVLVPGIWINRLAGGRIVESWQVWDTFGMLRQLGAVPS